MTSSSISLSTRPRVRRHRSGFPLLLMDLYYFFKYLTIGWGANGIGFLCRGILLMFTTTDAGAQVGFFGFVVGFIFLVHNYWVGSQRDRFLLLLDLLTYTTTGLGKDGVGFICRWNQFAEGRDEVGRGVFFVRPCRKGGVGRPRAGWWISLFWGPRSVGSVTERLIYYLVSCR